MLEYGKRAISRFWEEVFNTGNVALIDELFAPSYVLHDLATQREHDREKLKGMIGAIHGALPGTHAMINEQLTAEGDRVITRFTLRAPRPRERTAAYEAAVDEWLDLNGMSISRVSEQQIEESWIIWDAWRAEHELRPADSNWWWPPWS
jgi:hypothetical protein